MQMRQRTLVDDIAVAPLTLRLVGHLAEYFVEVLKCILATVRNAFTPPFLTTSRAADLTAGGNTFRKGNATALCCGSPSSGQICPEQDDERRNGDIRFCLGLLINLDLSGLFSRAARWITRIVREFIGE